MIQITNILHIFLFLYVLATKMVAAGNSQKDKGKAFSESGSFSRTAMMCGRHSVHVPLRYKSDQSGEVIELVLSEHRIEAGANGEFFVAFSGTKHRLESLPRNKCVAIKKMAGEERDKYCNAIRVLNWVQGHIDGTKRRHIARLFDAGHEEQKNALIIVSELGDETLKERLYAQNRNFLIDEMVMKIAVPLVELHQAAMHLDIKPSNYVFVKSEDDALKLIDFDGAELLLEGDRTHQCKMPQVNAHTMQYMSPEQDEHIFKQRRELSVKADIWSIGMITCEIVLQNRFYDFLFSKDEDMAVDSVLHYIGKFYRGYRIVQPQGEGGIAEGVASFDSLNLDSSDEWLDKRNYYDTLAHILRIAADYSLLFHLIINTLDFDPEQRMSARGIVDYLNKKCIPMTSKRIDDVWTLPLFQNVTFEHLKRKFEVRKDQKMLCLLSVFEKQQRKALNELKMRGTICETRNILAGEEVEHIQKNNESEEGEAMAMASASFQNDQGKTPKRKSKKLFSTNSKNDLWSIARTKFERLKNSAREEGDKPFLA